MASWEEVIRDGVLLTLLRQMRERRDGWEYPGFQAPEDLPPYLCSIRDIESCRNVSKMWRDVIDNSAEWACVRLARHDWSNEVGTPWESFEEYELTRFLQNWEYLGHSWNLANPLGGAHLQSFPVSCLTGGDLATLRTAL